ncbi:uncharacterized protein MONBRDRAFT_12457 [Monosiga brevicollis MX1]|uniref:VCBS repeat-containing protein n=1 Tax=Monosiga brevicollis TaxID=81824 RepID=A9VCB9_MONBE|nr:uncharacterized protein MONBRDRAFT_12457 [Monosiga brevicollis MX1]EDQ84833.1 predicted protein [Monosiga brevicollis MX1]|eukprot:XP_001750334.1 hypothetical protein [Monosiga brevicollis MX1]
MAGLFVLSKRNGSNVGFDADLPNLGREHWPSRAPTMLYLTDGDQLSWYRNLCTGTFTKVVIDAAADGVQAVMAADLDDDGVLELVAALREGQQLLYDNVERWA